MGASSVMPAKTAMAPAVCLISAPSPSPSSAKQGQEGARQGDRPEHARLPERGRRGAARTGRPGRTKNEAKLSSSPMTRVPVPTTATFAVSSTPVGVAWRTGRSGSCRCRTRRSSASTPSTPMASDPTASPVRD